MLNVAQSFISTFVAVLLSFVSFLRGPVLFIAGVITVVIMLASPAEAAVIQCNISDCSLLATSFPEWWSLIPWTKKAAFVLFFAGLTIGNVLMWHDRKVTAAKIKKEQDEWLKKYHS